MTTNLENKLRKYLHSIFPGDYVKYYIFVGLNEIDIDSMSPQITLEELEAIKDIISTEYENPKISLSAFDEELRITWC